MFPVKIVIVVLRILVFDFLHQPSGLIALCDQRRGEVLKIRLMIKLLFLTSWGPELISIISTTVFFCIL